MKESNGDKGGAKKTRRISKSDKPQNIQLKEAEIFDACDQLEKEMPKFFKSFFYYLKGNVLPMTRLAYLQDISLFLKWLTDEGVLTSAEKTADISISDFSGIKGRDVNYFLDYCRHYEKHDGEIVYIYENANRSLARKKSSLSVLFRHLYRDEIIPSNITDTFDPIRVPRPGEQEIKALQDDEVMLMLDAVTTGAGLTDKERQYWEKTKYRDKAVLIMFLTYGLRLSELQQLNLSSINFSRGEFKIFRKRGKEALMPLNDSVTITLEDYLKNERPDDDMLDDEHKDALFLSLQRRRMTDRQIRELVKKYTSVALKTSRDSGYSPHKLRATAATSLIGRGNSIFDVQALLDHERVTTTQLYAAHKKDVKRNLVRDMEWETERMAGKEYENDEE